MKLAVSLLCALAACADDGAPPEPKARHDLAPCDQAWKNNGYTRCEYACADSNVALLASGPSCNARTVRGNTVNCSKTFVFDDVVEGVQAQGCCSSVKPDLYFADCE